MRVLCFDDKKSQRDSTRALLEEQAPITVDFAINKIEADQHITDGKYDIVLIDIDLRDADGTSYQGDDWLKDQFEALQKLGIEPYIVTAQKDMIRDPGWIRSKNIPVIEKGIGEKEFYNKLRQRARATVPQQSFAEPPRFEFVTSSTPEQQEVAKVILDRTLGTFYDWIERLPDADVKDLHVAGQLMSPADVKREMRNPQSAVGSTMIALFIDHVRDLLGFDTGDNR